MCKVGVREKSVIFDFNSVIFEIPFKNPPVVEQALLYFSFSTFPGSAKIFQVMHVHLCTILFATTVWNVYYTLKYSTYKQNWSHDHQY